MNYVLPLNYVNYVFKNERKMKKVLILAYDFPPYVSVGGLRPYSWYKYFHEFGIYPIVVTRQWGNKYGNHLDYIAPSESSEVIVEETESGTIIRTPYKPNLANRLMLKYGESKYRILRRTISAYYELAQWIWPIGPKSQLYFVAREYMKEHKVDAIIATGEPFVLFKYASKLSDKFHKPWVADYRDPWMQDKSRGDNIIRKYFDRIIERKYIHNSLAISTVSEFFLNQIFENVPKQHFVISANGYDQENIQVVQNVMQNSDVLSIGFVGTLYKWHPLGLFLKELDGFMAKNVNLKVNVCFFGTNINDHDIDLIRRDFPNLAGSIRIYPRLINIDLMSSLAKMNILLLFNYYSYMGTKIYDYLGLKRKILFCFTDDENANRLKKEHFNISSNIPVNEKLQEELIFATNSGVLVKDSSHLSTIFDDLFSEFEEFKMIKCNSNGVEKYSRRNQTEKLAVLIKSIIN